MLIRLHTRIYYRDTRSNKLVLCDHTLLVYTWLKFFVDCVGDHDLEDSHDELE
jgi:hypothetical protein